MIAIKSSLQKLTRMACARFGGVAGFADRDVTAAEDTARHEFMTEHLMANGLPPSRSKKSRSTACPRD